MVRSSFDYLGWVVMVFFSDVTQYGFIHYCYQLQQLVLVYRQENMSPMYMIAKEDCNAYIRPGFSHSLIEYGVV